MPGAPGVLDKVVRIRPAQGGAGAFNQKDLVVATSQNIKMFDIVSLSSGLVQQSISLPGSNSTATASGGNLPTLGIALADIVTTSAGIETATGRTTIPVAILDSNLEALFRIYNATAANAQQQDITIGTNYQFVRYRGATSAIWFYGLSTTTTNGELKYVEPSAESAVTDNYGMVWVRAALSDTVRQG